MLGSWLRFFVSDLGHSVWWQFIRRFESIGFTLNNIVCLANIFPGCSNGRDIDRSAPSNPSSDNLCADTHASIDLSHIVD